MRTLFPDPLSQDFIACLDVHRFSCLGGVRGNSLWLCLPVRDSIVRLLPLAAILASIFPEMSTGFCSVGEES